MEKCIEIFAASYAHGKNTDYIGVMYYRQAFRVFRGAAEYATHEGAQLRAVIRALEEIRYPIRVTIYLSSKKLAVVLGERLGGYIRLGNIDRQENAPLLKRYHALAQKHRITLAPL